MSITSYITLSADKQISLPAASVGKRIRIKIGSTGNEAALVADALYLAEYVATNKWILTGKTKLGAAIAAIVPDALV